MEWYQLSNVEQVDSPAIILYRSRIEENIELLKTMIDDIGRLRPHVKTNKISEVVELMQQAGISRYKCATIAEAEMLAMVNADDVFLAYQPVGPKVTRLLELVLKYPKTRFACLVDSADAAQAISQVFDAQSQHLQVYIDLNVGMNRTGIVPVKAFGLYKKILTLPGIKPVGLHVYDGHIHDTDMGIRIERCDAAFALVENLADQIMEAGFPEPEIVAGGTPTFPIHALRSGIQCSPGTFVFWDWGYANNFPEQTFQWAAVVISRVISVIDSNHLCLDLGHKSIAAENPQPRVFFVNAPEAVPVSQSEEHLVLKVDDISKYPIGTVFYGIPKHICPTVALYEKAYVANSGEIVSNWQIVARDRQIIV
ncbi:D-TA family PLP-dependent enzyme [Chitinophaga silvatica]|uniref:D-TA family PLP-dependent enzyme n=1 Tax=Chitinophaga silvatica TaxID=2282649 RepID=A0A3E1YDH3_9BACT|nr:D-TA family PLP-dependent enzyme [Chitinophaga silvatica]RFS24524.1 D-TA family PLP-dependent enzyme [Chitinophaga silvatica]